MREIEKGLNPFIEPITRRDVLLDLASARAVVVTTRVTDLIKSAIALAADGGDKKDGKDGSKDGKDSDGKEGSKDGKDGKDGSDDKETCDPGGDWLSKFGLPDKLVLDRIGAVGRLKEARLQALITELGRII